MSASVIEKHRIALFEAMTPSTQAVAKQLAEKFVKEYTGIIKIQHQVGTLVAQVIDNEAEYGDDAVAQLANYLNVPKGPNTLYSLASFARKFERDYVEEKSAVLMANGGALTVQHWVHLSKLSERSDAEAMLERVYSECLSARDLELAIRTGTGGSMAHSRSGGGRNPKIPTSPTVGLQSLFQLGNKLVRFVPTIEKHVIKKLNAMDAEKITPIVVEKSQQTLEMIDKVIESATHVRAALASSVETMNETLSAAEAEDTKAKAKEKEAKEKAKEKEAREKAKEKEAKEKGKDKTKEVETRSTEKRPRKVRPIAVT